MLFATLLNLQKLIKTGDKNRICCALACVIGLEHKLLVPALLDKFMTVPWPHVSANSRVLVQIKKSFSLCEIFVSQLPLRYCSSAYLKVNIIGLFDLKWQIFRGETCHNGKTINISDIKHCSSLVRTFPQLEEGWTRIISLCGSMSWPSSCGVGEVRRREGHWRSSLPKRYCPPLSKAVECSLSWKAEGRQFLVRRSGCAAGRWGSLWWWILSSLVPRSRWPQRNRDIHLLPRLVLWLPGTGWHRAEGTAGSLCQLFSYIQIFLLSKKIF